MCFACGSQWPPFSTKVQVAPAPVKEETIWIDENTAFYPDHRQGIHPPGPVYQGLGAAAPTMFAPGMYGTNMYPMQGGYPGMSAYPVPATCNYQIPGYGAQQFMYPQTAAGMVPGQFPMATSPADLTAQAAAAAEHNKQIAAAPNAPPYMFGVNPVDMMAQNAVFGQTVGIAPAMAPGLGTTMAGPAPNTLAPYKPGEANQFWCRETDGSWTLRNYSEICLGEVSPGHWEKHAVSGYFFWVRHMA